MAPYLRRFNAQFGAGEPFVVLLQQPLGIILSDLLPCHFSSTCLEKNPQILKDLKFQLRSACPDHKIEQQTINSLETNKTQIISANQQTQSIMTLSNNKI